MVYKKVECEEGLYLASDGSRYEIFEATNVITPQGKNVGWDTFDNINEAANAYGLVLVEQHNPEAINLYIQRILDEEVNK